MIIAPPLDTACNIWGGIVKIKISKYMINPVFLIFAFSDTGTGKANPCDAAVERAYDSIEVGSQ
jgi:hypothetical protein